MIAPSKKASRYILLLSILGFTVVIGVYHHEKVKSHLAKMQIDSISSLLNYDQSLPGVDNHDNDNSELEQDKDWTDPEFSSIFEKLNTPLVPGITSNDTDKSKAEEILSDRTKLYRDTLKRPIIEPKLDNLVRPGDPLAGKAKATILSLVRDEDLKELIKAITKLEEVFNRKFDYPYVFLNDGDFSENFKNKIKSILPEGRKVEFGKIESEVWNMPPDIDRELYSKAKEDLKDVQYMDKESYHNMCRFYSKSFYHHPLLKKYKYTWRLEPSTALHCDIDYDVFQFMEMNDKYYGYTISVYDSPESVRSLWNHTMDFIKLHPQFVNPNGAFEWIKDNGQKPKNYEMTNGFSTCHFWTNFEVTNLEFLRSKPYEKYVQYLDSKKGFYYERWGDAPVRSLALALFLDKSKIHWFRDIGYTHDPYTNCPGSQNGNNRCHSKCVPGKHTSWEPLNIENCQAVWIKYIMNEDQLNLY